MEHLMEVLKVENANSDSNDKRLILKDFNHRINNDLQALLAFIKIQKRFGIDNDEIINSACVSIASISAIQNLMYDSDNEKNLISTNGFLENFKGIIKDNYTKSNINFSNETETDFIMNPKKIFHLMFLINEMINLSIDYSFKDDIEKNISFKIEKDDDECTLIYSDNGSGFKDALSDSNVRNVLFDQLIKQIDGSLDSSDDNSTVTIKFSYE